MRKALLVLAICSLAAPAWAGGAFSLFGTWSQTTEESEAIGAGVRLSYGSDHIKGDLTWTWLPVANDVDTTIGFDDDLQIIPTDLGVRYIINPKGTVSFYFGGGITYFWANLSNGWISDEWGAHGMGGFNFGKGRAQLFVEGTYRWADGKVSFTQDPNTTVRGDLTYGGLGINVGVFWRW
jgi:hypothetical protein